MIVIICNETTDWFSRVGALLSNELNFEQSLESVHKQLNNINFLIRSQTKLNAILCVISFGCVFLSCVDRPSSDGMMLQDRRESYSEWTMLGV